MAASKQQPEPRSLKLRRQLRKQIQQRIVDRDLSQTKAADLMGLSVAQTSRLLNGYNSFSLDRLVDAAHGVGIVARIAR